jgi:prepilin-type N-terminal cleavage/methylation domain-containing protein
MNLRRGFTFMELLVVVAIIAILAVILFPVFASAKPTGKAMPQERDRRVAASINNAKQIGLAAFMYAHDQDDYSPMHQSWQNGAPIFIGGCPMVTWAQSCLPYMTTPEILNDPLAIPETPPNGFPLATWLALYPQYGMNHTVWSPMLPGNGGGSCSNPWRPSPIAITGVARPAEVPMFVSRSTSREMGGSVWWYGAGTLISSNIVDPPACNSGTAHCFGNWGKGSTWDSILQSGGQEVGQYTGGNSRRRAGNHVALFGDGHAQKISASEMATGSNWLDDPSWPAGSTVITNPSIYRWTSQ